MKIHFDVANRKELAKTISEITSMDYRYLKVPSCAYQIGPMKLTKESILEVDEKELAEGTVEFMINKLDEAGYDFYLGEEVDCINISFPRQGFTYTAIENLNRILSVKGKLIRKALGVDALPVKVTEERVSFPWFNEVYPPNCAKAYIHFISALCDMAKKQSRVNIKDREVTNEKYAFRCFLLRLGFVGAEYKEERKQLLKNLSGSSAFKNGRPEAQAEKVEEEVEDAPEGLCTIVATLSNPERCICGTGGRYAKH